MKYILECSQYYLYLSMIYQKVKFLNQPIVFFVFAIWNCEQSVAMDIKSNAKQAFWIGNYSWISCMVHFVSFSSNFRPSLPDGAEGVSGSARASTQAQAWSKSCLCTHSIKAWRLLYRCVSFDLLLDWSYSRIGWANLMYSRIMYCIAYHAAI